MNSSIKRIFDINDFRNKIVERQVIINNYINFGVLDRGDAICKIENLRATNATVGAVYVAQVTAAPSILLESFSNDQLIMELQAQIDILQSELTQKLNEEAESHVYSRMNRIR